MNERCFSLLVWLGCLSLAPAKPITFDFKDPKGVNNVVFKTDAPLESVTGTATGISGEVRFDPSDPAAISGKLVVAADTLHVGNPLMNEHLLSDKWMDVKKFPEITFVVTSAKHAVTMDNSTTLDVTGDLTIKGAFKKITVPVKLTYLKDKLGARVPEMKGDLLVLRANFKVKRSDFGINSHTLEEKVSDEIELTLSLAGQAPR